MVNIFEVTTFSTKHIFDEMSCIAKHHPPETIYIMYIYVLYLLKISNYTKPQAARPAMVAGHWLYCPFTVIFFRYKTDSGFRSGSQWQKLSFFPKCMVKNSQSEKVSQSGLQLQP